MLSCVPLVLLLCCSCVPLVLPSSSREEFGSIAAFPPRRCVGLTAQVWHLFKWNRIHPLEFDRGPLTWFDAVQF
jgi:hypothetical protein